MTYIRAITTDNETIYLNTEKIFSITPKASFTTILLGAGLYWQVDPATIEFVSIYDTIREINE